MTSEFLQNLEWRYATKKFDSNKKVSEEDLNELLEALRLTPSSFGLEPWKFLVINNPALREKIKASAWNQTQITEASHLIILCAKKDITQEDITAFIQRIATTRGITTETLKGYQDMLTGYRNNADEHYIKEWNKKQVYIALGFLLATAAQKKIDTCPMEGFNATEVDKILELEKEGYTTTVLCPVGYRSEEDNYAKLKKVRYTKEEVIEQR